MRRANRSGSPSAAVNGNTVIASAPPRAAAKTAMVARRMFTCGSRRVIMRHAVSAATNTGFGARPQARFDARPQFPQRAEFGDGEKLIGVGGEPEIDRIARRIERDAACFERAQVGDGGSKREGQLLRLRSAGIVDDASVGDRERTLEAAVGKHAD